MDATYDAADRLTQMQLAGGAVVREFRYDSLGRLVETRDPDLGVRTLAWDDDGRLIREENATAQIVRYTYDAAGRLTEREAGVRYRYHYDQGRPEAGTHATRVAGRLAWVEEPTGEIDLGYDELGRTIFARRRIEGRSAEQTTRHAASGLVLGHDHDDGVSLSYEHDPAGRLMAINDLWQVLEQDAAGQILHEGFQNGVETDYERDVLGLVSKVTVRDAGGAALYGVDIARNGWSGITAVTDVDGAGLSHTASFTYDDFARLTAASIGTGASAYSFGYGYDALHNMTSRSAAGPRTLGVLAGTYRYGEGGKGPRQLTSIVSGESATIATFDYDLAGRQIRKDQIGLEYNGLDQLVRATGLPGGAVEHLYGHDGRRVKTAVPGGQNAYFFGEGVAERSGRREHDVVVADRIIARITVPEAVGGTAAASGKMALGLLYGVLLILLGWAAVAALRLLPARSRAAATAAALLACACSFGPSLGVEKHRLWGSPETTFLHAGVGAGPILYTDTTGQVVEERRYEPFGEEIDARVLQGGTYVVGDPDLIARDLNVLNKRTEVTTGWSDHGVRWMAPETARWLTPDPPVKGPDPEVSRGPLGPAPLSIRRAEPRRVLGPRREEACVAIFPVLGLRELGVLRGGRSNSGATSSGPTSEGPKPQGDAARRRHPFGRRPDASNEPDQRRTIPSARRPCGFPPLDGSRRSHSHRRRRRGRRGHQARPHSGGRKERRKRNNDAGKGMLRRWYRRGDTGRPRSHRGSQSGRCRRLSRRAHGRAAPRRGDRHLRQVRCADCGSRSQRRRRRDRGPRDDHRAPVLGRWARLGKRR